MATHEGGFGRDGSPDMSARDAEIVRAIAEEELSVFTFDGLRRITGAHPETLSRTLERLEDDGMVIKSPGGYSLTGRAREALELGPVGTGPKSVSILHTYLPYATSAGKIVEALKRRWFDNIRWVGMSEGEDGPIMKWVTDDGSALIVVKFGSGQLDIEAKVASEADLSKAVRGAHQLMGRISRLYASPRSGKVTPLRIGHSTPYAM